MQWHTVLNFLLYHITYTLKSYHKHPVCTFTIISLELECYTLDALYI